jgi:hypothetical protein
MDGCKEAGGVGGLGIVVCGRIGRLWGLRWDVDLGKSRWKVREC